MIITENPWQLKLKLAAGGDIYAKKLKATQLGWADFVFVSNYHLPSLDR